MDAIDLIYDALDILEGKEENDLDKKDMKTIRNMIDKLVYKYLCEKGKEITIAFVDMYCVTCHDDNEHKMYYSDGDRLCECQVCGRIEVL